MERYHHYKVTKIVDKIVENGEETTNPVEIADALNTFYVNIGKSVEQSVNIYWTFPLFLNPQDQIAFLSLF